MKARIKATGEVVEVEPHDRANNHQASFKVLFKDKPQPIMSIDDLIIYYDEEPNWEEREWQAAVAIMQAYIINEGDRTPMAQWAIKRAKELVAEYRKGE